MASQDTPVGDPAFEGTGAITHEPVVEEERPSPLPQSDVLRRPFPWAVAGVALAIVVVGIVAGASAGWQYAIPVVLLAGLILGFVATTWALGRRHGGAYPEGRAEDQAAADADNPIPHFGFDERTALGASSEQSDAEPPPHGDMERSTGRS